MLDTVRPLDPHGGAFVATQDWVGQTRGAVDTILKAWGWIDTPPKGYDRIGLESEPLIIANCDQLILLPDEVGTWGNGIVFTFKSASSAHSYVTTGKNGLITSIVEKPDVPPSDQAVSGVYAFTTAGPFIGACKAVADEAPEDEWYVSAALAKLIDGGYGLYAVEVPTAILGTPEDFQRFQTALQFAEVLS